MPLCYRRRLKFIHVPKTGGTALVRALNLEWTGNHNGWSGYPEDTRDFVTFTVVRDPVARFVSQYNFGMSKRSFWHIQGTKHEFGDYQVMKDMTLDQILADLKLPWNQRSLRHCGWWPQSWFICDAQNEVQAHYMLRQEHLQKDLSEMLAEISQPDVQLQDFNRSEPILSVEEVLADSGITARIVEMYRRDYSVLPYKPRHSHVSIP